MLKIRCKDCNGMDYYTRVDGTIRCRRCGYSWMGKRNKEEPIKKEEVKPKKVIDDVEDDLGLWNGL